MKTNTLTHITETTLTTLHACDKGIEFVKNNKLLPFPITKIKEIENDQFGLVDWANTNILSADIRVDENDNILSYVKYNGAESFYQTFDDDNRIIRYEHSYIHANGTATENTITMDYDNCTRSFTTKYTNGNSSRVESKFNDDYFVSVAYAYNTNEIESIIISKNIQNKTLLLTIHDCDICSIYQDRVVMYEPIVKTAEATTDLSQLANLLSPEDVDTFLKNIESTHDFEEDETHKCIQMTPYVDVMLNSTGDKITTHIMDKIKEENEIKPVDNNGSFVYNSEKYEIISHYNSDKRLSKVFTIKHESNETKKIKIKYDQNGNVIKYKHTTTNNNAKVILKTKNTTELYKSGQLKRFNETLFPEI